MKRTSWITWRIYFATFPIDVLVLIMAGDHRLKSWNDVFVWGLVSLFAHAALLPFVAFGTLQSERIRDWKFDFIFLLILGAIRGLAINYCVARYDLELTVSYGYKVFNSMIALPQWFVAMALFIESKREYQQAFRELFSKAMIKEQEGSEKGSILPNANPADEAIARIQFIASNLSSEIKNLMNRPQDLAEYSTEASKIQNLIDEDLRPTSSDLWKNSKIKSPTIPFKKLLGISLLENRLPVFLVLAISWPYLFVGINGINGAKIALYQCLLITAIDFSLFGVFEFLHRKTWVNRAQANIGIMLFSFLVALLIQFEYTSDSFIFSTDPAVVFCLSILSFSNLCNVIASREWVLTYKGSKEKESLIALKGTFKEINSKVWYQKVRKRKEEQTWRNIYMEKSKRA
jgi:hypothetical protein